MEKIQCTEAVLLLSMCMPTHRISLMAGVKSSLSLMDYGCLKHVCYKQNSTCAIAFEGLCQTLIKMSSHSIGVGRIKYWRERGGGARRAKLFTDCKLIG